MKRTAAVLLICLHLGGCASLRGEFDNRLVCSSNSDQAYLISMYGPLGLATKVSASDLNALCKQGVTK